MVTRALCRTTSNGRLGRFFAGAVAFFAPAVAWAQYQAPPQPTLNRYPQPWVGFLIIFALLVVVIGVSLIPSKRGHQD